MHPHAKRHPFGRIHTLYQPIIEIRTRKIFGYEALSRGTGKLRSPIDLFRESYDKGFTIELDHTCFKSSFRVLPQFKKSELLFVNVEPITLRHSFMKGEAGAGLLKKLLPYRHKIVFELTEGMRMKDFELIKRGAAFIRRHGFRFALDDVTGVGLRSITLLSLWPDFLKIDMSLIKGVRKSRLQQQILRRLVFLARKKGAHLIAEGIEHRHDLDYIHRLGIPYAQGFYFSHPRKNILRNGYLPNFPKKP